MQGCLTFNPPTSSGFKLPEQPERPCSSGSSAISKTYPRSSMKRKHTQEVSGCPEEPKEKLARRSVRVSFAKGTKTTDSLNKAKVSKKLSIEEQIISLGLDQTIPKEDIDRTCEDYYQNFDQTHNLFLLSIWAIESDADPLLIHNIEAKLASTLCSDMLLGYDGTITDQEAKELNKMLTTLQNDPDLQSHQQINSTLLDKLKSHLKNELAFNKVHFFANRFSYSNIASIVKLFNDTQDAQSYLNDLAERMPDAVLIKEFLKCHEAHQEWPEVDSNLELAKNRTDSYDEDSKKSRNHRTENEHAAYINLQSRKNDSSMLQSGT